MIRWIAEDLAAVICVGMFVTALLVIADGIAHSPSIIW